MTIVMYQFLLIIERHCMLLGTISNSKSFMEILRGSPNRQFLHASLFLQIVSKWFNQLECIKQGNFIKSVFRNQLFMHNLQMDYTLGGFQDLIHKVFYSSEVMIYSSKWPTGIIVLRQTASMRIVRKNICFIIAQNRTQANAISP